MRSYKNPRLTGLLYDDCKVWEACRATSAAPTFFAPIQIGKYNQNFIDGAAVANNPIQIAYSEARNMWPGRDAFILSIGTGSAPGLPFRGNIKAIVESMKKIVTETERTAEAFYDDHSDLVAKELLFRFNVTYGLSDISLQDYKQVDQMADATQTYLDHGEIGKKLSSCISRLSASIPKGNVSFLQLIYIPRRTTEQEFLPINSLVISNRNETDFSGSAGMKPAEVRTVANSSFVSNVDGGQRDRPGNSNTIAMSTKPRWSYLKQSNSPSKMFHTAPSPGHDSPSTRFSGLLYSSSETTILSATSSSPSLDRTQSAGKNSNARFINAAKNGETSLLVVWIKNQDVRSQLDQESINIALIELSKNPEHGSRRVEAVKSLLENCAPDLEYKDTKCGRTPLMWSALFSHEAIIKLLLDKGASLEALDETWRRTPLLWAATIGAYKSVEALLQNIDDPHVINAKDKDGNTALALAFISKKLVTAGALLRSGADPNLKLDSGYPLLVSAVNEDDVDFARLLVKNKADINCANTRGVPILSIAAYDNSFSMVRLLVENGADIHAGDSEGCTALIWAIKSKQFATVKALVDWGASRNVTDSKGLTAQHWALETRHKRIIRLIFQDA